VGGSFSLVVLVAWKVCVAVNSAPATCILASVAAIQSFLVVVDLLGAGGIHRAAVEEFGLSRRMNQTVRDVRCWVSRGLWMGLVYSLV